MTNANRIKQQLPFFASFATHQASNGVLNDKLLRSLLKRATAVSCYSYLLIFSSCKRWLLHNVVIIFVRVVVTVVIVVVAAVVIVVVTAIVIVVVAAHRRLRKE